MMCFLLIYRNLRKKLAPKILISLCISLMILLVVFLFATEARKITSVKFVCQIIACILHYFMLTTFMWMLVEAVNLYYSFVKIFNGRDKKKFFKWASWASWGMYIL